MEKGKFITFEGGEGSGKSTQASRLAEFLEQKDIPVILTREPGGTPLAESIRSLLVEGNTDKFNSICELLLYSAARVDHIERVVKPTLEAGTWVICDRFIDSTTAYQGHGHGIDLNLIQQLQHDICHTPIPDLTFLLDIDVKAGLQRASLRKGNENRYEQMDVSFHKRVREGFLGLSYQEPTRFAVIDASQAIQDIAAEIEKILSQKFSFS